MSGMNPNRRYDSPIFSPLLVVVAGLAWWFFLPDQLGLLTKLAYTALFVISLDLVVGIAGLPSLGHAALFGIGAYAAGIFATFVSPDPLVGLFIGALAGSLTAALSGLFLLRFQGFTFLMLTVATSQVLLSLANKFRDLTGGDDGLASYVIGGVFGVWDFDLYGKVASLYAIAALAIGYFVALKFKSSPFGLSVRGIHENRTRMIAIGTPIFLRLWVTYIFAGLLAGIAGAVSAQTNGIVALDSLSFNLSAEALVMLILGGVGRLHGAILGTLIFGVLHHTAASLNPYHWMFVVGAILMVVVVVPRDKLFATLKSFVIKQPNRQGAQP